MCVYRRIQAYVGICGVVYACVRARGRTRGRVPSLRVTNVWRIQELVHTITEKWLSDTRTTGREGAQGKAAAVSHPAADQ